MCLLTYLLRNVDTADFRNRFEIMAILNQGHAGVFSSIAVVASVRVTQQLQGHAAFFFRLA